jgi:hypothetical protein
MVVELEIKKLAAEQKQLTSALMGRHLLSQWVHQPIACIMMNIKPRQLRNVRIHIDKHGTKVGDIRWKKGKGRQVMYYKPDIEKYLNSFIIS